MPANGVERSLRGVSADAVTVAGKAKGALARPALIGDADVNEADGFFRRATAGAGDAGNSKAQGMRRCGAECPSARASATSELTAPLASMISAGTPTREVLSSLL